MKKLLQYAESINIAEELESSQLAIIATRITEQFESDWTSMAKWREQNDNGIDLSTPDLHPKTTPFPNSANYKTLALTQAATAFGDRASKELLQDEFLFMTNIIGKDKDGQKAAIAERVKEYENYHLDYRMEDWRDNQSDMLYKLPKYGTMFKKIYFDPLENRKVSCMIEYPNFCVSDSIKSLEKARSFTEIVAYSKNEAKEFQALGYWCDCDLSGDDGQSGSNESEGAESAIDNAECYYVQNTYLDLDDDGYEEPYVVTYHKGSGNVVRIVADYNIYGIMVRNGGKIISLGSAKDQGDIVLKEVMRTAELMKINRAMDIVKYGFIRGDGFLDIGYYWLLGALTQLVNTATNMMLDKGAQYNMGGGFLAKEFRKGNNSGAVSFKMGEYKQTDIPASVLQGGIVNLPVGEPSQILLQLLTMAQGELANFSASVDLSALIAQNVAPTTAAISVSEQLVPTAAIYQYIQRSQSKEFEKLMALTPLYIDNSEYQEVVGAEGSIETDYASSVSIKATAQKSMSSDVIRNFEIAALQTMLPQIQAAGGNAVKVIKLALGQLKSINTDGILPEMDEQQEAEANAKMQAESAKQQQLIDLQILSQQKAIAGFEAQEQAGKIKAQSEMAKIEGDILLNNEKIKLTQAQTYKEKANAAKLAEEAQAQAIENGMLNSGIEELVNLTTQHRGMMQEAQVESQEPMREHKMHQGEGMEMGMMHGKEEMVEPEEPEEKEDPEMPSIDIEINPEAE